jgi:hypothetical protein
MTQVSVLIVVDSSIASMADVVAVLTTHGLRVTRLMPNIGIISGDVDLAKLNDLSHVPGVQSVRQEEQIQLHPVHEDIPQ